MKPSLQLHFSSLLMAWNTASNGRKMPWKGEKNPYRIWLSEIILQQTRVEQGLKYYNNFISSYPDIQALADAKDEEVFKLWEGLGYYSRCKNLLETARYIVNELKGKFPEDFDNILGLKGVGVYTASAIASFAYNSPYAVIDGNVYRVLSRFFGIEIPIDTNSGKKYFAKIAFDLLDKQLPGFYNQAIMDFGALICKPAPNCDVCPLSTSCKAYNSATVNIYPVKLKKVTRRFRWLYYFVVEYNNCIYIRKRLQKDIWQNLHEPFLVESEIELNDKEIRALPELQNIHTKPVFVQTDYYHQVLTHQTIKGAFNYIKVQTEPILPGFIPVCKSKVRSLAFPKSMTEYFEKSGIFTTQ